MAVAGGAAFSAFTASVRPNGGGCCCSSSSSLRRNLRSETCFQVTPLAAFVPLLHHHHHQQRHQQQQQQRRRRQQQEQQTSSQQTAFPALSTQRRRPMVVAAAAAGGGGGSSSEDASKVAAQQSRRMQLDATKLLALLLQADDLEKAVRDNLDSLTEDFFVVSSTYLDMARKEGNPEVVQQLESVLRVAMTEKDKTLRPEIRLLNQLLRDSTPTDRSKTMSQYAEYIVPGGYFFNLLNRMLVDVEAAVQQQGRLRQQQQQQQQQQKQQKGAGSQMKLMSQLRSISKEAKEVAKATAKARSES